MATELNRIRVTKDNRDGKYCNLIGNVNTERLKQKLLSASPKKAAGVDGVTKLIYQEKLEENLALLVSRMKARSYRPQAVRRVFIPKPGSDKMRPLGMPALEDKLVQGIMADILNEIYEPLFMECSYGFRRGRNAHQAVKRVRSDILRKKVNYVVDVDIKGFFDNMNHDWIIKFLAHEIKDKMFLRYIKRFLIAGVMENTTKIESDKGSPQGGLISPAIGNVYLHYAVDLWFEKVMKKVVKGYASMTRYADDIVYLFQYKNEAKAFAEALKIRLAKFNLELSEEKSEIMEFGRFAKERHTFDFLGFTFINGKRRKDSKYTVILRTSKKKLKQKRIALNQWLKEHMHDKPAEIIHKLGIKLVGHYRYYGVTGNYIAIAKFLRYAQDRLKHWLSRRGQKRRMNWYRFNKMLKYNPLPAARIYVSMVT